MTKGTYLIAGLSFLLSIACCKENPPNYPPEPFLDFKKIEITNETDQLGNQLIYFNLTLNYTDGDANLGREPSIDSLNDYNCIIRYYRKLEGSYQLIVNDYIANPFYCMIHEIPKPHSTYLFGPLTVNTGSTYDGELKIRIAHLFYDKIFLNNDTLKVTVEVIDNDKNHSNIAEIECIYPF